MELEQLLEELERSLSQARRLPLTGKLVVDEGKVLALLEEIRQRWPEELRQARWISKERERVLSEARAEAESMVQETRQYLQKAADESAIAREAQHKADQLLAEAQRTARELRQAARAYADEVLADLEGHLVRALENVRRGRQELGARRAAGEGAERRARGGEG